MLCRSWREPMSRLACARTCASLVTIALLTSSQLLGCASSSSTLKTEATAQAKSAAPIFLWTLSKDGKPGRAHLYGSVHLKPSGQESVDRAVTRTFDAATDLVDILYGNNGANDLLNIGVVPWNAKVNVTLDGTTFDSSLTTSVPVAGFTNPVTGAGQSSVYQVNNSPVPLLYAPPSDWKGCVYNRYIDNGFTDDDADIYMGPQVMPGADWPAWEPVGPEGEPVSGGTCAMSPGGWSECTPCLEHGITALQSQKQTIIDAIDELQYPEGTTNIPQGLGWAWRVLMPDAPFTEAVADPDYDLQRAIVLLTDGENHGGVGDGYKQVFGLGSGAGSNGMDARLRTLANNIKSAGGVPWRLVGRSASTTITSPGSTSRTKSAPMMSSAQVSDVMIQASPILPRTSGRTPSGSRAPISLRRDRATSE